MLPPILLTTTLLIALTLASLACTDKQPTSSVEYLIDEIPPCTPISGYSVDPCDPDPPRIELCIECFKDLGDEPLGLHEAFVSDYPAPYWIPHLVLRGTYLPGTFRCTHEEPFRPPVYLQDEIGSIMATISATTKCYFDVRVNDYIIGTGPTALTILVFYWPHGREEQAEEMRRQLEADDAAVDAFAGREHIMFLKPPVDLSTLAWLSSHWDVQRRVDNAVVAVHPARDHWRRRKPDGYLTFRSVLEMELPAFAQAVTEAHEARLTEYEGRIGADYSLPMLVTDANKLRQFYTDTGAYDHPDGTPVPPPPLP